MSGMDFKEAQMSFPASFQLAAWLHLVSSAVEATELLGHTLPVCGSKAADLAAIFVAAFLIHDMGRLSKPLRACLRAWWRRRRDSRT